MSNAAQLQKNITIVLQYQGTLERALFSIVTTLPCCVFLFINVTMLFTLRSKPVFWETSRYILLFNLLFADTVLLAQSQLMYLLAASRLLLSYPVCGALCMFNDLTIKVSPLTLMVMSLERYVAVCYPLRHATIITKKNTGVAIIVVWSLSSLHVFIQVILLLHFSVKNMESLQMTVFCAKENMQLDPVSDHYENASTCFLFVSAGVAVISSYIGVMIAARSASTDKASARKARNTLLLHLVQLGLSLSSTSHTAFLIAVSKVLDRTVFVHIQIVLYLCVTIFPRCLSSLIYGIRDQTIRPVLRSNLCCQWRPSASLPRIPDKVKVIPISS